MIDDLNVIEQLDQSGMLACLHKLPEVALPAFERGRAVGLPSGFGPENLPDQILVCGMGGSAISGDLLRTQWLADMAVPVWVHRGDRLPAFAGPRTLVIALTYSGQTAETLGCLREAIARGVPTAIVTSGGVAGELAAKNGLPRVNVAPGWQPRAALGDLFFALLGLASQLQPGCENATAVEEAVRLMRAQRAACEETVPVESNPAKALAVALQGKTPIILGANPTTEAVALRWKCQINENAKMTVLYGVLPEMTHNDIVNLSARPHRDHVIVALTDPADSAFVQRQRSVALALLAPGVAAVHEIAGEGDTLLARQLTACYLGDYVSVYLALLDGLDPTPVEAIQELKRRLSEEVVTQ